MELSNLRQKGSEIVLKEKFELFLERELFATDSFHPHFNEAYKKMFQVGGKRFRPLLLLSIVNASNPLFLHSAMFAATALEMIHTYSLIHDDLPSMDNSSLRRGHPTLHVSYDEASAILIGDALNTDAFLMISKMPIDDATKVRLIEVLSKNAGSNGMVLGQAIDCYFENVKLTDKELSFLHVNKTGKLIAASLQMGAIIANLDMQIEKKLYDVGLDFGLLFQVNDDIIDATKMSHEVGKPTKQDSNKNSYVNLFGIKKAEELKKEMIEKLNIKIAFFDEKIEKELKVLLLKYIK